MELTILWLDPALLRTLEIRVRVWFSPSHIVRSNENVWYGNASNLQSGRGINPCCRCTDCPARFGEVTAWLKLWGDALGEKKLLLVGPYLIHDSFGTR